jgi:hypothetical protein
MSAIGIRCWSRGGRYYSSLPDKGDCPTLRAQLSATPLKDRHKNLVLVVAAGVTLLGFGGMLGELARSGRSNS